MPNQPKTPARSLRIPDELWHKAQERAREDGTTVTAVVVAMLMDYTQHR